MSRKPKTKTSTVTKDGKVYSPYLVGEALTRWETRASLDLKPQSVFLYKAGLGKLFEVVGLTTEEFSERFETAQSENDTDTMEDLQDAVKAGIKSMCDSYANSTVSTSYKAFISFMKYNRMKADFENLNRCARARTIRLPKKLEEY